MQGVVKVEVPIWRSTYSVVLLLFCFLLATTGNSLDGLVAVHAWSTTVASCPACAGVLHAACGDVAASLNAWHAHKALTAKKLAQGVWGAASAQPGGSAALLYAHAKAYVRQGHVVPVACAGRRTRQAGAS